MVESSIALVLTCKGSCIRRILGDREPGGVDLIHISGRRASLSFGVTLDCKLGTLLQ